MKWAQILSSPRKLAEYLNGKPVINEKR